eukprot:gnl/MRDRNA2_/MRDRNA2_60548_c0_seq1.p1 gnl/MRDRNA2_/MRDRNA2_60548_c0~~gnl/MRDRNA2_/MRDRNA2_60548_c0_seq1.p1  ORF type:complete len:139 (-),score=5.20 gnl/MRDRNA2_/MRDRNA2_60548_c0_seq1:34-450(-)
MALAISSGTVKALFAIIASLAAISCLTRADYNLPLFTFLYFFYFTIPKRILAPQQRFLSILVAVSILQDFAYGFYWMRLWSQHHELFSTASIVAHRLVIVLCFVEIVLKFLALGAIRILGQHFLNGCPCLIAWSTSCA